MLTKITLAIALTAGLAVSTVRQPIVLCNVANTATEKACHGDCCASKTCCDAAEKRTSVPFKPINHAPDIVAVPAASATLSGQTFFLEPANFFSPAAASAHSRLTLALICVRLI